MSVSPEEAPAPHLKMVGISEAVCVDDTCGIERVLAETRDVAPETPAARR